MFNRAQNEDRFLTKQLDDVQLKIRSLEESFFSLSKILEQNETELTTANIESSRLQKQVSSVEKQVTAKMNESTSFDDKIQASLQAQETLSKGTKAVLKQITKLKLATADNEAKAAVDENAIRRIEVEALETQARITQQRDVKRELEQELADQRKLVDQYEVDVRRRAIEIEVCDDH